MRRHFASASARSYAASSTWLARLGKAGYYTKGAVYAVVGILALRAAFGAGGSTEGARGAILEIAEQTFGQILLAITAIGLFAYALWRFVDALLDPESVGSDAKGLVKRTGFAVSGLIYLGLSVWSAWILLGHASTSGGGSEQAWTAQLLAQPLGSWLIGGAGAVIVGVGLHQLYRAYTAGFMEHYDVGAMSVAQRRWARRIGRFGISARSVTFMIIGAFLIRAALQFDPSEARGLGGALQSISQQPYGPWLLAVVAAGFIAFGIYCASRARYSRFRFY